MAVEGIQIEVADGFARIEFLDKSLKGPTLSKLLEIAGPESIDLDTGGTRRTYIVPESVAKDAGLIDAPKAKAPAKKAPAKAAAKPAADQTPAASPFDNGGSGDAATA